MKKQIIQICTLIVSVFAQVLFLLPAATSSASAATYIEVCGEFGGTMVNGACSQPLCFADIDSITIRETCLGANPSRGITAAEVGRCYLITGHSTSFVGQGETNCLSVTEEYVNDTANREQRAEEINCTNSGGVWTFEGTADNPRFFCDTSAADDAGGAGSPEPPDISNPDDRKCEGETLNEDNCGIVAYLNVIFNFISGGIVLAVIGNIIYSGIMYSTAEGDPGKSAKAKKRIAEAIVALIMYMLLYSFITWLIPGGVF